jgi:hypothetical protein
MDDQEESLSYPWSAMHVIFPPVNTVVKDGVKHALAIVALKQQWSKCGIIRAKLVLKINS